MARRQRLRLALDAEQPADEVFDVRSERDEQLGFRLPVQRVLACRCEPIGKSSVRFAEECDESAVEPDKALAFAEVGEGQAEAELHAVRIIVEIFQAFPY